MWRRFRPLSIVDEFTRETLAPAVDTSIGGHSMAREGSVRPSAPSVSLTQLSGCDGPRSQTQDPVLSLQLVARDYSVGGASNTRCPRATWRTC